MNGIDRIKQGFTTTKKKRLMTHVVGGYPDIDTCERIVLRMAQKGVDFIEVQLPFSDPIADGPVIVQANYQALRGGATTEKVFAMCGRLRKKISTPLLVMTYLNPLYAFGIEKSVARLVHDGLDGFIVPDYPLDEPDLHLADQCNNSGIALVPLIAPTTSLERMKDIAARVLSPFVYAVLRLGVTGKTTIIDDAGKAYLNTIKTATQKYVAGGFGIQNREQVAALCEHADCAIVGSALLKRVTEAVEQQKDPVKAVDGFLEKLLFLK